MHFQEYYGVDWDGPVSAADDGDHVYVPDTTCSLGEDQVTVLKQTVDPLEQTDDLGVSLYVIARTFVNVCIS